MSAASCKTRTKPCRVLALPAVSQTEQEQQTPRVAAERRSQVGSGMRNERIRTYNFPQGRVTDHRIGLTLYQAWML